MKHTIIFIILLTSFTLVSCEAWTDAKKKELHKACKATTLNYIESDAEKICSCVEKEIISAKPKADYSGEELNVAVSKCISSGTYKDVFQREIEAEDELDRSMSEAMADTLKK
jgi:PBP1b-binding outer membrane lipoprotein LpoB